MPNLNKVQIIGHLGADPEIRYTNDGMPVANFRVAATEKWKGKDGQKHEETEWFRVVLFGASAEKYVGEYMRKGDVCYVEGKLKTREWKDQDGNDQKTTEVVADRYGGVQILGGKRQSGDSKPSGGQPYNQGRGRGQEALRDRHSSQKHATPKDFDDELPF